MAGPITQCFPFFLLLPLTLSSLPSPVQRAENIMIPIDIISGPKNSSKRAKIEDGAGVKASTTLVNDVHSQALTTAECANFRGFVIFLQISLKNYEISENYY
eukprot:1392377-Amorphochlora_amoeboformis.AAC.1